MGAALAAAAWVGAAALPGTAGWELTTAFHERPTGAAASVSEGGGELLASACSVPWSLACACDSCRAALGGGEWCCCCVLGTDGAGTAVGAACACCCWTGA
jgi:hypothetical protein